MGRRSCIPPPGTWYMHGARQGNFSGSNFPHHLRGEETGVHWPGETRARRTLQKDPAKRLESSSPESTVFWVSLRVLWPQPEPPLTHLGSGDLPGEDSVSRGSNSAL